MITIRILISLCFATTVLCASQDCPPLPKGDQFKPFQNTVQNGLTKFQWYSDVAPNPQQGGGHPGYAFDRKVDNQGKGALKYIWKVGRMYNIGLPEGAKPDFYCGEFGWPNQKDGPLDYGRGNDSTGTTVWEGKDEPTTPSHIAALLSFTISDTNTTREVALQIESEVTSSFEGLRYTYTLKNIGRSSMRLNWKVADLLQFRDALNEKHLEFPMALTTGARFENSFSSRSMAQVLFTDVQILSNDGKELAGASVPTLLPK